MGVLFWHCPPKGWFPSFKCWQISLHLCKSQFYCTKYSETLDFYWPSSEKKKNLQHKMDRCVISKKLCLVWLKHKNEWNWYVVRKYKMKIVIFFSSDLILLHFFSFVQRCEASSLKRCGVEYMTSKGADNSSHSQLRHL